MLKHVYLPILMLVPMLSLARGPVDHGLFDKVLKQYVNSAGGVDYEGLKANPDELEAYLELVSANHPDESWTRDEQLAYWINVYNAYTLKLIIEKYPVESIKDIGSWIQIPFVNTPWDIKFIEIGEEVYDLNNVEHDILRDELEEPRIHFAIVCASYSCPRLSRDAYTAERIEEQLDRAAIDFLNDPDKNKVSPDDPQVSKIFSWFGGDFKKEGTIADYINQYSTEKIAEGASLRFLDYDWGLNTQDRLK